MRLFNSLTGRFLILTMIFVIVAEILIFVPSVARYRMTYLSERLERAQIASLSLLATDKQMLTPELQHELLTNAGVVNITLRRDEMRELILSDPMPAVVDASFDLREATVSSLIMDAFETMFTREDRLIRVVGKPVHGGGVVIEATLKEKWMRDALLDYGWRIFWLSLVLSMMIAGMVFVAVRALIGRPIRRLTEHIQAFQAAPEDQRKIISPQSPIREFYKTEESLAAMETQLSQSLQERKHMVALGEAVSKISHDLRNMLTTTQLLADRMDASDDPLVKRVAPKLVNALSRAVNLAERTLSFGRAEEPAPELAKFNIHKLITEIVEAEELAIGDDDVAINVTGNKRLSIWADRDQIFRVISNITRNARQVLQARGHGVIDIKIQDRASVWSIVIKDDGPGMPPKARQNMFMPFKGSARAGGSGLGLAIAAELVSAHDGSLILLYSGDQGTAFEITLPKER